MSDIPDFELNPEIEKLIKETPGTSVEEVCNALGINLDDAFDYDNPIFNNDDD